MRITAGKLNGKVRQNVEKIYEVMNENTIKYCNAMRELYELGFTDNPFYVDEVMLRKAFIEEFEDSGLLSGVSSGDIYFDENHLKYAKWVSKDTEFKKVCDLYIDYIVAKEKLQICGELIDDSKITKFGMLDIPVRFLVSEGVKSKSRVRLIPEFFLTDKLPKLKKFCIGDCTIHAVVRELGISEEEYQEHLSTGQPFFVKDLTQEQESELVDLILCYDVKLDGKYGDMLAKKIVSYYKDYMMETTSKFYQVPFEGVMFTKSLDYKKDKLSKISEEMSKLGGKEVFLEADAIYYSLPASEEDKFHVSKPVVGGWCLDVETNETMLTTNLFEGVQGVFTFNNKDEVPAYIKGFGMCYFVSDADYFKLDSDEQLSDYDSVSLNELRELVRKFVSSSLAEELVIAVLSARCDEYDFDFTVDFDTVNEGEYNIACKEAIEALQYTFNLV